MAKAEVFHSSSDQIVIYIRSSISLYLILLFLCVQGLIIYSTSAVGAQHQVVFVLELEEGK